jgi:3-ketosteroid 9alpha-monooxygenase subunit B
VDSMTEVTVTVAGVRPETPGAVTLRLDLGGASFPYRPGQYIEIDPHQFEELAGALAALEAAKGMPESPRGFSLASDGSDPGILEISVKEEKGGKFPPVLSPWLVHEIRPGRKITLSGPQGRYVLPEPPPGAGGFLHVCAGSGVAPNRGMIRSSLAREAPARHLLVLQNRTEADIFYRDEWPALAARFPDRFKVRHVLSVTAQEHVSVDLLRGEMAGFLDGLAATALVCGPNRPREVPGADGSKRREPGFCELWGGNPRRKVAGRLAELGFTPDRILMETW